MAKRIRRETTNVASTSSTTIICTLWSRSLFLGGQQKVVKCHCAFRVSSSSFYFIFFFFFLGSCPVIGNVYSEFELGPKQKFAKIKLLLPLFEINQLQLADGWFLSNYYYFLFVSNIKVEMSNHEIEIKKLLLEKLAEIKFCC